MTVFLSYGTMGRHKYSKLTNNVFSTTYDIIQLLRKLHDPSNIRCVCTVVTGSAARSILFLALYGHPYRELLFVPF